MALTSQMGSTDKKNDKHVKLKLNPAPEKNPEAKARFAVTIGKSPDFIFKFWRDFSNLALFMKDLKQVEVLTSKISHWTVQLESGFKAEWDAEITSESPNDLISWKSIENSDVQTSGTVWFQAAPQGLGTIVSLDMDYSLPGGKLTEWITMLKGEDPDSLVFTNLRRLKCYLETGEIATTKGQSSGRDEDLETANKH